MQRVFDVRDYGTLRKNVGNVWEWEEEASDDCQTSVLAVGQKQLEKNLVSDLSASFYMHTS